ncbi:hypothetical protein GCM10009116_13380 [Brevundimonas basaltis]|uniref:Uncharacterized protein n=1 Tax=Brevundimonas basaltis TaxID=472166 RepID=A0A7W8HWT8_9CAUL|nr:hypothetical protein [Brevundimonas basaltis]MBB5291349.1 hypothetical protein [Brevundimonas basaltis]
MPVLTTCRATVIVAGLALSLSAPAGAGVRSYPVQGSATTEALACRAVNRSARIGSQEGVISISPCRCVQRGSHDFVCTVIVTRRTDD